MTRVTHLERRNTITRLIALVGLLGLFLLPKQAHGQTTGVTSFNSGLNRGQTQVLYTIARQTWKFYSVDVDPTTHLPMDNIGLNGAPPRGAYTSPTNIGVYLWSIVAAMDLGFIGRVQADTLAAATLTEVQQLDKHNGFLYSWYDTRTGQEIIGPNQGACSQATQASDKHNCAFLSSVDNAWYASGLIVTRQALPELASTATSLLSPMNFGIFFRSGDECTDINAGQVYGGYYTDTGPTGWTFGLLNAEIRVIMYVGLGLHQLPGDVWWRTWRTLPSLTPPPPPNPASCVNNYADFSWQTQQPQGYYTTYTDPDTGRPFTMFEGHYSYGGAAYVPSWGGSMFEGLMPNLVVPETSWGPNSFGLNDAHYVQAEEAYVAQALHYPVWGLSPSSTPDDTGGYGTYGAVQLGSNLGCCPYDQSTVTPHASFLALDVSAKDAFANIQQLRSLYPGIYGPYGFFDAVNPTTGSIGHRYLVLDQSMIMAALDNALNNRRLQRYFAQDPVSSAARTYLGLETMSIGG